MDDRPSTLDELLAVIAANRRDVDHGRALEENATRDFLRRWRVNREERTLTYASDEEWRGEDWRADREADFHERDES